MSYFFGLSGLSGIATHLDSTGNILVDIADGIGLVSKVNPAFYYFHSKKLSLLLTLKFEVLLKIDCSVAES